MRKDCPLCEGRKWFLIANTNIKIDCEFCDNGVIPKPENYDVTKEPPGLVKRITNLFGNNDVSEVN